ncbi:MAG: hypothetical protein KKE57_01160 [Proteobacteria bacterium]|nr:hypothetical protein [Pseudomonadota bacterium]
MVWKKRCLVLIALPWFLWVGSSSASAQGDYARETLRGLAGVRVNIELTVSSEIEVKGLSERIQSDVESKLEGMGIRVLSKEEVFTVKGGPLLLARVDLMKHDGKYVSFILMQLYQHVLLIGEPREATYPAVTWSTDGLMAVLSALEDLRGLVLEEAGRFAQEFLQANPK